MLLGHRHQASDDVSQSAAVERRPTAHPVEDGRSPERRQQLVDVHRNETDGHVIQQLGEQAPQPDGDGEAERRPGDAHEELGGRRRLLLDEKPLGCDAMAGECPGHLVHGCG